MVVKVFLLGRPGSGKTTAFSHIEELTRDKELQATRFREYTILYKMFQAGRKEFRPVAYGGFDIVDFSILRESAQRLEEQVQELALSSRQEDELLFLELARNNYKRAMLCFSSEFLRDSYFLFIEADVETCIHRIRYRVAHPTETDGHFVSERILRSYYSKDNKEYMATRFKNDYDIQKKVEVIENSGPLDEFFQKLKPFVDTVLAEKLTVAPVKLQAAGV
jgi:thymidylate kinase